MDERFKCIAPHRIELAVDLADGAKTYAFAALINFLSH
jgi:hypothetical protein